MSDTRVIPGVRLALSGARPPKDRLHVRVQGVSVSEWDDVTVQRLRYWVNRPMDDRTFRDLARTLFGTPAVKDTAGLTLEDAARVFLRQEPDGTIALRRNIPAEEWAPFAELLTGQAEAA
jgi:hypothetical protein